MKPPERFPPDDPREWLNRARSNLALATQPVTERDYGDAVEIAEAIVSWAEKSLRTLP